MIFILPVQKLLKAFLRDSFSISNRDELKEMLILLTIQDAIYLISGDSQLFGHFRHSESSGLHFRVPLFTCIPGTHNEASDVFRITTNSLVSPTMA